MKKTVLLVVLLTTAISCGKQGGGQTSKDAASGAVPPPPPPPVSPTPDSAIKADAEELIEPTKWVYDTTADKMTSVTTYTATIHSVNDLTFEPPYSGPYDKGSIVLRKRGKSIDVMLGVWRGQFTGDEILVKFDDSPAQRYSVQESSDFAGDVRFVTAAKKFIAGLIKAKHATVRANFFQEGHRDMEFNVNDLKWN